MTRRLAIAFLSFGILLPACGGSSGPDVTGSIATIVVTPALDTVVASASTVYSAEARDADGRTVGSVTFTWQVVNPSIAAVNAAGVVTGLQPGTTNVTASADGVTGQATVVVIAASVASVTVSPSSDSVAAGSVVQYRAVARDANNAVIAGLYPTWSVVNGAVASVSPTGLVHGLTQGNTMVTASFGGTSGSAQLKVRSAFTRTDTVATPLIDLAGTYLSFQGRLYPGGNVVPSGHLAGGTAAARSVARLDVNGNPSQLGAYVLMSIGMSNTTQEWCSSQWDSTCNAWSFSGQAAADPQVRTSGLVIVNGARGGQTAPVWTQAGGANYIRIRDTILAPRGLSEKQVQAIWLKVANLTPSVALPEANADALTLYGQLGAILRALKTQYPNLKLVFLTSRVYAGYNAIALNPEPYAYEYGFSMQWLIAEQIRQVAAPSLPADPAVGDLDYTTGAVPWVGWGPYLWTRGTQPRSDGLTWPATYLEPDGVHPSDLGEQVVGSQLLAFFKTAATTRCWFATSGTCP